MTLASYKLPCSLFNFRSCQHCFNQQIVLYLFMLTGSFFSRPSWVPLSPAQHLPAPWHGPLPHFEVLLSLINLHGRTAHPVDQAPTPAPAPGAAKAEKVKRPAILAAGTSEEWAYFEQQWSDYKAATHLTGSDIVFQLLECCDEALRKDLTRTFGTLASSDEQTILSNMKTLRPSGKHNGLTDAPSTNVPGPRRASTGLFSPPQRSGRSM